MKIALLEKHFDDFEHHLTIILVENKNSRYGFNYRMHKKFCINKSKISDQYYAGWNECCH